MRTLTSRSCILLHYALEILNLLIVQQAFYVVPGFDSGLITVPLKGWQFHTTRLCRMDGRCSREMASQGLFDYRGESDAPANRICLHFDKKVFVQPHSCPVHGSTMHI